MRSCFRCNGSGRLDIYGKERCPVCNGSGDSNAPMETGAERNARLLLENGRVVVGALAPVVDGMGFYVEVRYGEFASLQMKLTREELYDLGEAIRALLERGRNPRRGP